jgi:hypothetical protein
MPNWSNPEEAKNRLDKFCLIVDLSCPQGHSVNDGISRDLCSFRYTSVREAATHIRGGAFMAKIDLKSAYRMVPVHSGDQHLLGLNRRGTTYINSALPFGLRSAPIIFMAVADALAWAMLCRGVPANLHYLDDFLLWAHDAHSCPSALHQAVQLCAELGLHVEP